MRDSPSSVTATAIRVLTSGLKMRNVSGSLSVQGWVFWRCFASAWVRRRDELLKDLLATLGRLGIEPCSAESRPRSIHTEQRTISISDRESSA